MHRGSCLCGTVEIEVRLDKLPEVVACHCTLCRKWSGHFGAGVEVPRDSLVIKGEGNIGWYAMTDRARRGFCKTCGTNLFFDPIDREKHSWTGVTAGVFNAPTLTKLGLHIFAAEKGDYYEITDGVKQNEY